MKKIFTIISFFILCFVLTFCGIKQELQMEFPQEIQSVFYQKNIEKSTIQFCIEFQIPLAKTIHLKKVYFHNQQAVIEAINTNKFVAHFTANSKKVDLILDSDSTKEYANKPPVTAKSKFELKSNEAVLEYQINNKTNYFKITNVIERVVR